LGEHIVKAFQEARDLSSSNTAVMKGKRKDSKPSRKVRTTLR